MEETGESHRGDDNHEVRRDAGDLAEEVRSESRQVALGKLARWKDLQHVGRLHMEGNHRFN